MYLRKRFNKIDLFCLLRVASPNLKSSTFENCHGWLTKASSLTFSVQWHFYLHFSNPLFLKKLHVDSRYQACVPSKEFPTKGQVFKTLKMSVFSRRKLLFTTYRPNVSPEFTCNLSTVPTILIFFIFYELPNQTSSLQTLKAAVFRLSQAVSLTFSVQIPQTFSI